MIEFGKHYKTQSGHKITLLTTCRRSQYDYTVVGLVHKETEDLVKIWKSDGTLYGKPSVSGLDLVEVSPYEGWEIDAPIWVRHCNTSSIWIPRHFAGIDPNGYPLFWPDGFTSHTYPLKDKIRGDKARLASEFTPA